MSRPNRSPSSASGIASSLAPVFGSRAINNVDVDGLCSATFFNAQALPSAARRFLLQIDHQNLVTTSNPSRWRYQQGVREIDDDQNSKWVRRRLVHVRLQLDQRTLDSAIRNSSASRILLDLYQVVTVSQAKAARPIDFSPWLFCTSKGKGYFNEDSGQATGWDSMWQRFMRRLLKDTKITERFTEHDLRGKVGSDLASIERATDLLGHASREITKRHYRRKPEVIKPVR